MDTMVSSIIRSIETCIHERLAVLEEVIRGFDKRTNSGDQQELQNKLEALDHRLRLLELRKESPTVDVPIKKEPEVWIDALKDLEIVMPVKLPTEVVLPTIVLAEAVEEEVAEEEVAEEEEEVAEEVEEEVEEEEEVAEEEEEEEVAEEEEEVEEEEVEEEEEVTEEDAEELEEITFKGKTYFKDSDNNIYQPTDDEVGDPIGVWDVARARVLFKRTT